MEKNNSFSKSRIGSGACIGSDCRVGDGTLVEPRTVLLDGTRVGRNCNGTLPDLEKQLEEAKAKSEKAEENRLLKEEVGEEEIAEVVSAWTGIPVAKLVETEREKLLHLPELLHKRVIGQEEGVCFGLL